MKHGERLAHKEVMMALGVVNNDTIENFRILKMTIEIIEEDELEGYDTTKLRDAACHLLDVVECSIESVNNLDLGMRDPGWERAFKDTKEQLSNMRKELA